MGFWPPMCNPRAKVFDILSTFPDPYASADPAFRLITYLLNEMKPSALILATVLSAHYPVPWRSESAWNSSPGPLLTAEPCGGHGFKGTVLLAADSTDAALNCLQRRLRIRNTLQTACRRRTRRAHARLPLPALRNAIPGPCHELQSVRQPFPNRRSDPLAFRSGA